MVLLFVLPRGEKYVYILTTKHVGGNYSFINGKVVDENMNDQGKKIFLSLNYFSRMLNLERGDPGFDKRLRNMKIDKRA